MTEFEQAMSSLNVRKIRAFCNKHNIITPERDEQLILYAHKCVAAMDGVAPEVWARSATWLKQHGYTPKLNRWREVVKKSLQDVTNKQKEEQPCA